MNGARTREREETVARPRLKRRASIRPSQRPFRSHPEPRRSGSCAGPPPPWQRAREAPTAGAGGTGPNRGDWARAPAALPFNQTDQQGRLGVGLGSPLLDLRVTGDRCWAVGGDDFCEPATAQKSGVALANAGAQRRSLHPSLWIPAWPFLETAPFGLVFARMTREVVEIESRDPGSAAEAGAVAQAAGAWRLSVLSWKTSSVVRWATLTRVLPGRRSIRSSYMRASVALSRAAVASSRNRTSGR